MLSDKVEQRFTIPGYYSIATTLDGERFTVEFENKETGRIDPEMTIIIWARHSDKVFGEIVTQSVPFTY